MKVLLTGAMGFLGSRTLEKLVDNNSITEVIATVRTIWECRRTDHPKVKYHYGDLNNREFVEPLVSICDAIVHTAALSSPWGEYGDFYKANVDIQKLLIQAAKKFEIKRFVYVSTPSMYFELMDKLNIKESDPLPDQFINAYAQTKREAEAELESSGIPYVSIRPRALIGRGDTIIMPRLIRAYDEGKLKIMGTGKNIVDLTSVSNVADALILGLFVSGEGVNQVYNISNGTPVQLWDKISMTLQKLGKQPPKKKVPFWLALFVARIMELISRITNKKEPALTVYGVGTLTKSFTMDISKANELLGYNPSHSIDDAIEEFVQWYKIHEEH